MGGWKLGDGRSVCFSSGFWILVQNVSDLKCRVKGLPLLTALLKHQPWTAVDTSVRSTIHYFMELWELFRTINYLVLW